MNFEVPLAKVLAVPCQVPNFLLLLLHGILSVIESDFLFMLAALELCDPSRDILKLSLLAFQGSFEASVTFACLPLLEAVSLRRQVHDLLLARDQLHLELLQQPLELFFTLLDFCACELALYVRVLVRRRLLRDCLCRQLLFDGSELLVLVSHLFVLAAQLVHLILQVPLYLCRNERLAALSAAFAGPCHQFVDPSKLGIHFVYLCLEQILL